MTGSRLTHFFERARTRRPVSWVTLVGVLLLPVVVGGILIAALYQPTQRLDQMSAAIVNEDQPVTVNGQLAPLGRQLTAGLVKGGSDQQSNLAWVISNASDAKAGLADGTYQAVVTIPKNFSAAATSAGTALSGSGSGSAEKATIAVESAPNALIIDDAITSQIADTAASVMGQSLSSATLKNVFIGYSTLGTKIGEAADGADKLASGATSAADGAAQLSTGLGQLSTGMNTWAAGATSAANGLDTWASGARTLAEMSAPLNSGLTQIANGLASAPAIPPQVVDAANALAANQAQIRAQLAASQQQLHDLVASCAAQGGSAAFCEQLAAAAKQADAAYPTLQSIVGQSGQIAAGVNGLSQLPTVGKNLQAIAGGYTQIAAGYSGLADGAQSAASGVHKLAAGATSLAGGASSSAAGAAALSSGVSQLATGTASLATGLHQASDALPRMNDAKASNVATVLANPVTAQGAGASLFGVSAIPLLATVALWFGALASFVALQAVSRRALASRRPSVVLALRSLAPAAVIGAVQGLLVAGIVQLAASYDVGTWSLFAALCVVAGVTFAAVNQALVAVFGGAGRWIAALVGVLAVATGVVSTVPGVLVAVASVLPTAPAANAMLGVLTTAGGVGAGVAGLLIWALLAFLATTIAVTRRRTTTIRALRAAPVAP